MASPRCSSLGRNFTGNVCASSESKVAMRLCFQERRLKNTGVWQTMPTTPGLYSKARAYSSSFKGSMIRVAWLTSSDGFLKVGPHDVSTMCRDTSMTNDNKTGHPNIAVPGATRSNGGQSSPALTRKSTQYSELYYSRKHCLTFQVLG